MKIKLFAVMDSENISESFLYKLKFGKIAIKVVMLGMLKTSFVTSRQFKYV